MVMLSEFKENEWKKMFNKVKKYGWTYDDNDKYITKQLSPRCFLKVFYIKDKQTNEYRAVKIRYEGKKESEITISIKDESKNGSDKEATFTDLLRGLEEFYYLWKNNEDIKYVDGLYIPTDRKLTDEEKQKIIDIVKSQNILNFEDVSKYKNAKTEFEKIYNNEQAVEHDWQKFFQKHLWVLGLSLQQQLLIPSRASENIKNELSKRNILDGSLISKGKVNYLTICEFKRSKDKQDLLVEPYRNRNGEVVANCFAPTSELSGGIAQILQYKRNIQKEAAQEQKITDIAGNDTGKVFQIVDPKCYLIIGNLEEIKMNDGKKTMF